MNTHRHDWNTLKTILRENYASKSPENKENVKQEDTSAGYWNKLQTITGKSKPEIKATIQKYRG